MALLSIQNLKTYLFDREPPVKAVDGAFLTIQPGEVLALVGESGCGKTMLALSIAKLLPPHARIVEGKVLLDGTDLTGLTKGKLRFIRGGKIAYIFQDPFSALNPVMSVGEQLLEALRLHQNLSPQEALKKGIELLGQVKIPLAEDRIRQYPHQLSGGMRQRVMIAMALTGNPELLVADEPTTALDVATQAQILKLLMELKKLRKMSILLITHDLFGVAHWADRIAVMYAGRIVEVAGTQGLYQNPSHPYTQALLACLPKVGEGRQALSPIPGSVPDLRFTPQGCPFHPRCPEAFDRCPREEPQLKELTPGHWVSCFARGV